MQIRRPIAAAISWTIFAEIIRRHGPHGDLRVIEMHPGGGMYDLLTLCRVNRKSGGIYDHFEELASINLLSGILRASSSDADEADIFDNWLRREDPADVVTLAERVLGFAPVTGLAASNRWTFGPRLFASLLGSQMARRDYLDARMCSADTSGYGGGIVPHLADYSAIADFTGKDVPDDRTERAALCWLLTVGPERKVAGVFRMDGRLSSAAEPELVHDLFNAYRKSRSLSDVTSLGLKLLGL